MTSRLIANLRSLSVCNFDPGVAPSALTSDKSIGREMFFTLHNLQNELLYVSETAIAYTGIDFGVMSFPDLGNRIYRVKMSLWINNTHNNQWVLFYKLKVDIRNLIEVNDVEERDNGAQFLPNTILWRFEDGAYCLRADLHDQYLPSQSRSSSWSRSRASKPSYTLDDIRQLTSLSIGIKDFAKSKDKISGQIKQVSEKQRENPDLEIPEKTRYLRFDLHNLHKYIAKQNGANDALHSELYRKKLHIGRSNQIIEEDFPKFKSICLERIEIAEAQIEPLHDSLVSSIFPGLITVLQEIGTVLQDAYPIELLAGTGRYSICGIEFPSTIREILDICYYGTSADATQELGTGSETVGPYADSINAGLSYIIMLMTSLAQIMGITFKYPMKLGTSGCYLVDNLSPQQLAPSDTKRVVDVHGAIKISYPLFYNPEQNQKFASYENPGRNFTLRNAPFEQGLNLLNKNLVMLIGQITDLYSDYYHDNVGNHLISNNIPVDCLDNFLWNLQYLLLFITAPSEKRN